MTDAVLIILLVIHIGAIIGWMGGAILFISIIAPSLRKMSPPTRSEFIVSALPSYSKFIETTSIAGVVAGILLFDYITNVRPSLAPSGSGLVSLEAGAVLGLIAIVIGFVIIVPAGNKMISLVKQMSTSPSNLGQTSAEPNPITAKIANLQKRLGMGGGIGIVLLAIALLLMVIGSNI